MNSDSVAIDLGRPSAEWSDVQHWLAGVQSRAKAGTDAKAGVKVASRVSATQELRRELEFGRRAEGWVLMPVVLGMGIAVAANLLTAADLLASWNGVVGLVTGILR